MKNKGEKPLQESMHVSEWLFALAGAVILAGAFVVYQMQDFPLWLWAIPKAFYVSALILFVKYS